MTAAPTPISVRSAEEMLPRPFQVTDTRRETPDTMTLALEPTDGAGIEFAPGQFTMVYVFGVGEVPLSISGGRGGRLVHTVRAVGAVTRALCALEPGDAVGIRGPYGTSWPVVEAEGRDLVIAAGGIGLAPLRSTVQYALNNRDHFGYVSLIYGTRSPGELLYEDELRDWRSRFEIEVEVTVDRAADGWYGDVGLVTNLLPRIVYDPEKTTALVCGPEIMMKVVARELGSRGVPLEDVYVSLERNMKCAIGFCGHCQYGPDFVCKDGPVVPYSQVRNRMRVAEV